MGTECTNNADGKNNCLGSGLTATCENCTSNDHCDPSTPKCNSSGTCEESYCETDSDCQEFPKK